MTLVQSSTAIALLGANLLPALNTLAEGPTAASTNPVIVLEDHSVETNLDLLLASDLTLTQGSIAYQATLNGYELGLNVSHGGMYVDYQPNRIADLIGTPQQLRADRFAFQLDLRNTLSPTLTGRLGSGFYDGFTNYRTLWIDEYYRQQFSRLSGYEKANPYGVNGLAGIRWDYLPGTGTVEITLSYQQDRISPGYDRPLFQPLERGLDRLKTGSVTASVEQVLSPRLRGRFQYNLADTTNRTVRHAAQLSLNYSLADRWVTRIAASQTREVAGFRSQSYEILVEHDWDNRWFLGVGGRYYRDNGDIENSLFVVTTAAPDLTTRQVFLSIKWVGTHSALRLEAGPYAVDYATPDSIVAPFAFLYSQRNFFRAGLSYSYNF